MFVSVSVKEGGGGGRFVPVSPVPATTCGHTYHHPRLHLHPSTYSVDCEFKVHHDVKRVFLRSFLKSFVCFFFLLRNFRLELRVFCFQRARTVVCSLVEFWRSVIRFCAVSERIYFNLSRTIRGLRLCFVSSTFVNSDFLSVDFSVQFVVKSFSDFLRQCVNSLHHQVFILYLMS